MRAPRSSILLTLVGLLLTIGSIAGVAVFDRHLLAPQAIRFADPAGVQLRGSYHPGSQPFGVLLLEGFGADQVTLTSLASEFASQGWHVFTFDFAGHGRSAGGLTFDNAQTDTLARQALAALEEFEQVSGLNMGQIFVAGHSLGARVALQSATLNPEPLAGLVLLGAQVNLATNVQSEFFTGTTDAELPWVQALGPGNPPVPILLVSGAWDDILTPAAADLLFQRLGGAAAAREMIILPGLVHNYEPFSPRVIAALLGWLGSQTGALLAGSAAPALRIWAWMVGLAGMFVLLAGARQWLGLGQMTERYAGQIELVNPRRFLWGKLLLWLAALPLAAILGSIFFFIPLGKPVFNLIYVGFIGGYGLLLLALYGRGKMPGVRGRLWDAAARPLASAQDRKSVLAALGIFAGMLILTAAYARTGWFYAFPLNVRLAWLLIFAPVTALGFWIGLLEGQIQPRPRGMGAALTLIGLFPFFLYTILMAALGSLSGMLGGLQGLVVLALVLAFGSLVQAVGRRPWLAALCMAVLLYWLILPQGVLFQ